ncbi:MAG TPA: Uma2 family endonuclease, partial [Tepidiformaceae bacterium]|nr:Uma2 family endonuclease [Tepidiformaceae bacterium]
MATRTRLTLEEFLALPGIDERRLELIDGEVYEKMSPRWGHSRIALKLGALFDVIGFAGVEPRAIIPPGEVDGPSAPLPDVAFYRTDPPEDDEWMTRPPDVAVEIRSIGQRRPDIRAKVDLYLRFGVPSVWVVDLESEEIEIYEGGGRRILAGNALVESEHAPGLRFTVA